MRLIDADKLEKKIIWTDVHNNKYIEVVSTKDIDEARTINLDEAIMNHIFNLNNKNFYFG